jgi:hypothetical protein
MNCSLPHVVLTAKHADFFIFLQDFIFAKLSPCASFNAALISVPNPRPPGWTIEIAIITAGKMT